MHISLNAYIHSCIHTYKRTRRQTYIDSYIFVCMNLQICVCAMRVYTHINHTQCTHTQTQTHTLNHHILNTRTHKHTHTRKHTHTPAHAHARIRAQALHARLDIERIHSIASVGTNERGRASEIEDSKALTADLIAMLATNSCGRVTPLSAQAPDVPQKNHRGATKKSFCRKHAMSS